jgi:hypothetical protein
MMSAYDLALLPPEPPEPPTLAEALADLAAALGLAAAGATDDACNAATPTMQERHHGRASGLREARALVEALARGLVEPTAQPTADDLPPDLDW